MKIDYKIELEPVSFIAGDYQEFQYRVSDSETGLGVSLKSTRELKLALCPYGDNENPVLVLDGELLDNDASSFLVKLKSSDTENLSGLYLQQPIIIDNDGQVFRPGQGTVNIYSRAYNERLE